LFFLNQEKKCVNRIKSETGEFD